MSFCGTIALRKKMELRSFYMHCHSLAAKLIHLKYEVGIDKTDAGDQLRLFQLTNDERADFAKFALNLRFLTETHTEHGEAYWKLYRETDYNSYDFFKMLQGHEEEAKPCIAALEKVAGGEKLTEEETKAAHDFLYKIGYRADGMADDGGCF